MTGHLRKLLPLLTIGIFLLCSCGSERTESERQEDEMVDRAGGEDGLTYDETHQTWSTASRVLSELIEGAKMSDFGMMPISEGEEKDFSSVFPEKLGDYMQAPYDPQMIDKEQYSLVRMYQRDNEKLLFTIYRFETPLNMYNFFIALDSMYQKDPSLTAEEIKGGQLSGWHVKDSLNRHREIGIMLDDYTFLQADANPEFKGDMMELVQMLNFGE